MWPRTPSRIPPLPMGSASCHQALRAMVTCRRLTQSPRGCAQSRSDRARFADIETEDQECKGYGGLGLGGERGRGAWACHPGLASLLPPRGSRVHSSLPQSPSHPPLCHPISTEFRSSRTPQTEVGLPGKVSGIKNAPLVRDAGVSKAALRGDAAWPAAVSMAWVHGSKRHCCSLLAPPACRGRPCRPHSGTQAGAAPPPRPADRHQSLVALQAEVAF